MVVRAIPNDLGYFFFVAGQQYRVWRILHAGILATQQVQRGLAASAQKSGTVFDAPVLGAHDRRQPIAIGRRER
jgi:hypothetical protein